MSYVWCLFELSVRTKRIVPTYFFEVLNPLAISRATHVVMIGGGNNLRTLIIIIVAELSTINVIPSVSHEKVLSFEWLDFVVKHLHAK